MIKLTSTVMGATPLVVQLIHILTTLVVKAVVHICIKYVRGLFAVTQLLGYFDSSLELERAHCWDILSSCDQCTCCHPSHKEDAEL